MLFKDYVLLNLYNSEYYTLGLGVTPMLGNTLLLSNQ